MPLAVCICSRISKGVKTAYILYLIWWLFAMAFAWLLAPDAVRLVTGSANEDVVSNAVLYIRISIPMFPPMGYLIILRNVLQGMCHRIAPLLCSSLELIGKVVFGFWIVPVFGYLAVCVCEPVTWIICFVFILGAAFLWRGEFREEQKK